MPDPSSSQPVDVSPTRAKHPLADPVLGFDLGAEAEALRREDAFEKSGHNAKTLVKHPGLRAVLVVLRDGARMQEHHAPGEVTVQVVAGGCRMHLDGDPVDLGAGSLLALDGGVPHDVEALRDTVLLLTLSWPTPGS